MDAESHFVNLKDILLATQNKADAVITSLHGRGNGEVARLVTDFDAAKESIEKSKYNCYFIKI